MTRVRPIGECRVAQKQNAREKYLRTIFENARFAGRVSCDDDDDGCDRFYSGVSFARFRVRLVVTNRY